MDKPSKGEVWEHTASKNRYRIVGTVFNCITDKIDVLYEPLYVCEHKLFSRQMEADPKAFLSCTMLAGKVVDRFVRVDVEQLKAEMGWPAGCYSPGSCARHGHCMYTKCPLDEKYGDALPGMISQVKSKT